jgi:hypothetical protein
VFENDGQLDGPAGAERDRQGEVAEPKFASLLGLGKDFQVLRAGVGELDREETGTANFNPAESMTAGLALQLLGPSTDGRQGR